MADICSKCGHETTRSTTVFDFDADRRLLGKFVFCRVCRPSQSVDTAKNPFANLTLDHVKDERGQKVTVNSLKELRAAEKRYNFALAVASDDGGTAAAPPQHEAWAGNLGASYDKKFNRDPAAYSQVEVDRAAAEMGVGVALDPGSTLAEAQNKTGVVRAAG
jgi:hypothetical protein